MSAKAYLRGHEIYCENDIWLYADNNQPTIGNPRRCGHCKKPDRKDDIDVCLGYLSGVLNACCGHGNTDESYIQFENGLIIRGFNKIEKR